MQTKKPTLAQKKLLKAKGLNPANWLVNYEDNICIRITHRESGNSKTIWKENY